MQVETPIEQRETNDFTKVEFPIRIGEFQHLNDGLIGYWLETEEGKDYKYERIYFTLLKVIRVSLNILKLSFGILLTILKT
jgi:hypothetical protein